MKGGSKIRPFLLSVSFYCFVLYYLLYRGIFFVVLSAVPWCSSCILVTFRTLVVFCVLVIFCILIVFCILVIFRILIVFCVLVIFNLLYLANLSYFDNLLYLGVLSYLDNFPYSTLSISFCLSRVLYLFFFC